MVSEKFPSSRQGALISKEECWPNRVEGVPNYALSDSLYLREFESDLVRLEVIRRNRSWIFWNEVNKPQKPKKNPYGTLNISPLNLNGSC